MNLSNFCTNNVTDMKEMFYGCSSLTELNISNFNTNKVIDMKNMFFGCSSLKSINITNLDINNDTNINNMLYDCPCELINQIRSLNNNITEEAIYYYDSSEDNIE